MKHIKFFSLVFILSFGTGFAAMAQPDKSRFEQIESIKVAFFTSKLDLSQEEAQRFWPIYNSYQAEWWEMTKNRWESRSRKNISAEERVNTDLEYESQILDLKKKYKKLYEKAIPAEKILRLYQAEKDFREHLIKQLNHRKGGSRN